MNAHELANLIHTLEEIDAADVSLAFVIEFFVERRDEVVAALRELEARRKAANDEHGIEVPS